MSLRAVAELHSPTPADPGDRLAPAELIRLLQFASPTLPIGAFAFSQGLEAAVELGFVRDEPGALDWLLGTLAGGLVHLDLPVLERIHAAWLAHDEAAVERWSEFLLASRESAERREEERHLGRALARLLVDQGVPRAAPWLGRESVTHACVFALAATHFGIPSNAALLGFAFSWAENQVGALSRLVPLGQLAAQRVLAAVGAAIPAAVERARTLPDSALGAGLPGVALACALHESQYTRLFKS
ncbi:MAG TPA: urease accessory UreF family protein [Polyangiaceae bacterium]